MPSTDGMARGSVVCRGQHQGCRAPVATLRPIRRGRTMSVLTHGVGCRTHTFPTKCRRCGDAVFFFRCSCGSRVFFDKLGWPWPEHDCEFSRSDREWADGRVKTKLGDGSVLVEISNGVTATRPGEDRERTRNIHPRVVEAEETNARSREANPIESVPSGCERTIETTGVVREIIRGVDVYERLDLLRTSINKGFLGILGSGRWGRMTIHVLDARIFSYTAWVQTKSLLKQGLVHGVTVSGRLERLDIARLAREWVCTELRFE